MAQRKGWGVTNPQWKKLRGGSQGFAGAVPTPKHLRTPTFGGGMKIQTTTPKVHFGSFLLPKQKPTTGHAGSVQGTIFGMRGMGRARRR